MITLLGVGHVFDIGRSIRSEILARRPKVVALELDAIRYQALLSRTHRGPTACLPWPSSPSSRFGLPDNTASRSAMR